ncbi:MAG: HRDC domain-containing protein, partial [Gemmatimonadetes bacterium]|nr:HRDC domain-containing protein [Gemmatimonadota bacterium]
SQEPYTAPTGRGVRLTPEEETVLARLTAVRNEAATRLGLERGRVMPNQVLRKLARLAPSSLSELRDVPELRRWQVALLGSDLLAAL